MACHWPLADFFGTNSKLTKSRMHGNPSGAANQPLVPPPPPRAAAAQQRSWPLRCTETDCASIEGRWDCSGAENAALQPGRHAARARRPVPGLKRRFEVPLGVMNGSG